MALGRPLAQVGLTIGGGFAAIDGPSRRAG
jgi:hypothetical protein